jgi:hypothetical protein
LAHLLHPVGEGRLLLRVTFVKALLAGDTVDGGKVGETALKVLSALGELLVTKFANERADVGGLATLELVRRQVEGEVRASLEQSLRSREKVGD